MTGFLCSPGSGIQPRSDTEDCSSPASSDEDCHFSGIDAVILLILHRKRPSTNEIFRISFLHLWAHHYVGTGSRKKSWKGKREIY